MKIVPLAKYLLPPFVVDAIKSIRTSSWVPGRSDCEYIPEGWGRTNLEIKGWNDPSVAETQEEKWETFLRFTRGSGPLGIAHEGPAVGQADYAAHNTLMCFGYALALAARCKDRLTILDWGGGLGHYYVLAQALLPDVAIEYFCKEFPALCRTGRRVLPRGTFVEDEKEAFQRTYDFVLASGSAHYTEDWRRLLSRLAAATQSYLYVTRLPIVHRASSFVVLQRAYRYGYKTEYLGWFFNRQEFLNHMSSLQVDLVRDFLVQETFVVKGAPEQAEFRGFLFRRREE
jgi:putative methyltransferase (TIGR04325 family)